MVGWPTLISRKQIKNIKNKIKIKKIKYNDEILTIPKIMRTPLKLESQKYSLQIPCNIIIKFTYRKFEGFGTNLEISLKMQVNTATKKVEIHCLYSSRRFFKLHCIPLPEMF